MTVLTVLPMQANLVNAFGEIWIPWLCDTMIERFCEHTIALVKADGKDILRVSLAHQQGKSEE